MDHQTTALLVLMAVAVIFALAIKVGRELRSLSQGDIDLGQGNEYD